nr:hypothetical protein MEP433_gp3 [Methylophilales phage MEP433]WOZ55685.1 hypothetical protein MEP434_gp3 [Methylophilales phage MEP434]
MIKTYTLTLTHAEMREVENSLLTQQRELTNNRNDFREYLQMGQRIRQQIKNKLEGKS